MINNEIKKSHIMILLILGIICYARLYVINSTFWDDNGWILYLYNSNTLDGFLNGGFRELRRVAFGSFIYYLITLHKNTGIYFPVFHSISIITQTCTPIFIYLIMHKVFRNSFLALCVALVTLLYPIDTTTPIVSNITYRIGLLLSVISLYTSVAAIGETVRWRLIAVSMTCAALAQYVFIEGAVALEPARLLILWHLLSQRENERDRIRRTFTVLAALFLTIVIPLVYYKLMYKPYGIYAGTYQSDPFFLLRWRMHRRAVAALFFLNWFYLSKFLMHNVLSAWSIILAMTGALAGYFQLGKLLRYGENGTSVSSIAHACRENRFVFLLGLAFYVPPVFMYEFAGRVVFFGVESRHGTLLVIGLALIWGGLFHAIYTSVATSSYRLRMAHAAMAMFIGTGIFFHNVNHDLYLASQRDQQQFWRAFTHRFPTLPEKSAFLFDVETPPSFYISPYYVPYSIELYLNMLYARSDRPDGFKNYIAAPAEFLLEDKDLSAVFSRRHVGTGHPFDGREPLYIIKYRDGKLYVNSEILKLDPRVHYVKLLNGDLGEYPQATGNYPLRYKLTGYY